MTQKLQKLQKQLAIFSDLMPRTSQLVHHFQMFLFVADRKRCTYQEIEAYFHLSNASVSRSLDALGDQPRNRQEGMGLVERIRDPGEGRRYLARLTKRGALILRQLESA